MQRVTLGQMLYVRVLVVGRCRFSFIIVRYLARVYAKQGQVKFCCYLKFLETENIFLVVYVKDDQVRSYLFPFWMVLGVEVSFKVCQFFCSSSDIFFVLLTFCKTYFISPWPTSVSIPPSFKYEVSLYPLYLH